MEVFKSKNMKMCSFVILFPFPFKSCLFFFPSDLYYGGEAFSVEQPQAFTCPYCGRMGYTELSLQEHVAAEHTETSTEVVSGCLNNDPWNLLCLRGLDRLQASIRLFIYFLLVYKSYPGWVNAMLWWV